MENLKIGEKVRVHDPGLIMIEKFRPPNVISNTWGWVHDFHNNGDIVILFPIGDDDPGEHSQTAPYPPNQVKRFEWEWNDLKYPENLD